MGPRDTDDTHGRCSDAARILLDGSLLLQVEQTGIGAYPRAIADVLQAAGARVDLLLSGRARPQRHGPEISMATQVFGRPPQRSSRLQALAMLWRTGLGYRRHLVGYPVPVEGMAVDTLEPRLPKHDTLFNANEVRDHAHLVFARRGVFTEITIEQRFSAMHWTAPLSIAVRGVPNIYTFHDLIPLRFPHFCLDAGGRAARLHATIARRADHIITTSERSREDLVSILGLPDERISVVYQHSVPPSLLPQEDAERLVSDVYGAEPGQYAFFCGAMEPKKNLHRLIEAFTLANTGHQLLLAGPHGWLNDDVRDLVARLRTTTVPGTDKPLVQHLGYLPRRHVTALIQCCSFFVFPSVYEGFGLPVLEAMQIGVPVLTSTGGSLPEVAGDAAVLVNPLDTSGMMREIRDLALDWGKRTELAGMGKLQAEKFSFAVHVEQMTAAYRRLGIPLAPVVPEIEPSLAPDNRNLEASSDRVGPVRIALPVNRYGSYDIAAARRAQRIDGLALIFFMGLGDYLMATPVIEALRQTHADLPIYAYASSTLDEVNSPLLAGMLRGNPNIDRVFVYRGKAKKFWKDYDFSDAAKDIPGNFLILPVLFNNTDRMVPHRTASLLQTFGLPQIWPVPRPVLYPEPLSETAQAILRDVRRRVVFRDVRGVVCCHFDVRSSGYVYPYAERLVRGLITGGYFVVSFSKLDIANEGLLVVDVTTITPNDTAGMLTALRSDPAPLLMVTVNSMIWALSAALDIPNLGLQTFHDTAMHQYAYPNISVITSRRHPRILPERLLFMARAEQLFMARGGSYTEQQSGLGLTFVHYRASFVLECFGRFTKALGRESQTLRLMNNDTEACTSKPVDRDL
jgi:glycosyltransferase involved in cell wall biosynthesis